MKIIGIFVRAVSVESRGHKPDWRGLRIERKERMLRQLEYTYSTDGAGVGSKGMKEVQVIVGEGRRVKGLFLEKGGGSGMFGCFREGAREEREVEERVEMWHNGRDGNQLFYQGLLGDLYETTIKGAQQQWQCPKGVMFQ